MELRFFCSSDLKMLEDISLFMSGATSVFCLPCNVVTARGCCGYSGHPSEHHLCLVPPYAALHALEQQHGGTGTLKHQQCWGSVGEGPVHVPGYRAWGGGSPWPPMLCFSEYSQIKEELQLLQWVGMHASPHHPPGQHCWAPGLPPHHGWSQQLPGQHPAWIAEQSLVTHYSPQKLQSGCCTHTQAMRVPLPQTGPCCRETISGVSMWKMYRGERRGCEE